jgi:hypothetical protein
MTNSTASVTFNITLPVVRHSLCSVERRKSDKRSIETPIGKWIIISSMRYAGDALVPEGTNGVVDILILSPDGINIQSAKVGEHEIAVSDDFIKYEASRNSSPISVVVTFVVSQDPVYVNFNE